jgi:class 3 adenylate cyclase
MALAHESETRYTRTQEGHHLAYQVAGEGPVDLLVVQSTFVPVDALDEEPALARFHRRLATFCRVITFDFRGIGLSDPVAPTAIPSIDHWAADAVAVLDAAGSEKATVLAPGIGSLVGLLVAATRPDRVTSLITVNGTARLSPATCYDVPPAELFKDSLSAIDGPTAAHGHGPGPVEPGSRDNFLELINPSIAGDQAFRAWWDRVGRRGASPAMAVAISEAVYAADVRRVLPLISVPTLVVQRGDSRMISAEHGRYLADNIPRAIYTELPGEDNLYWLGDADSILDEIEEFLTGTRHGPRTDRLLTTVLFTDIVGSTERIVAVGERRWRDLLDYHDEAVRRQLQRFGGRQVKTTGDGVLATFDGPGRAVQCASAIRDAADELGLEIRAGVHTGEVEVRGEDIGGLSVHIGARVAAAAGPGEILVSRTVTDLVVGSGLEFTDRGEHELKGVPGRWQLFAVAA